MLKRISAALLGAVLFAGIASAQETTIKFTLGWKTQGRGLSQPQISP